MCKRPTRNDDSIDDRKKTYLMAHLLPENNYNQGCKSKTIKYKG